MYTDIEMQLIDPMRGLPTESASLRSMRIETTQNPLIGEDIFIDDIEMMPTVTTASFKDTAKELLQQTKASFSAKDTALSVIGATPTILKELSHHIPGLGAVLSSSYFADDFRALVRTRRRMIFTKKLIDDYFENPWEKRILDFKTSITVNRILENTLLYALSQLERRYNKQANAIVGRALQVMGSSLTFAGLFTHGATVPLGVGVGAVGSIIKARFSIRSAYNNLQRRIAGNLSVNREEHAKYLYGLTLLHLQQTGKHDGNYIHSRKAAESIQTVQEIYRSYTPELAAEFRGSEEVAAQFVASIEGLDYIDADAPTRLQIDHFLEYGLWSIMLGIKS
jgi:hypothetical protein